MKFDITPTEAELKDAESMTGDAKLAEKIALDEADGIETIMENINLKMVYYKKMVNLEKWSNGVLKALAERTGEASKSSI